ncbi:MAG: hybrid sensor histidine kinase/response regulator [Acidobacteriota bacterium]
MNQLKPEQSQSLALLIGLTDPDHRREAALALAHHLGAGDLIIFIVDHEVRTLLPAPGFPQTLPSGLSWRALLSECSKLGQHTAEVAYPDAETKTVAAAIAAEDGSILALLGGQPRLDEAREICSLLPLLSAAFQNEKATLIAGTHATVARESAAQAKLSAQIVAKTRADLEHALRETEAANRSKDEFLAMLSHELRTPLNAILGWTTLLRNRKLDKEATEHAIDTIDRNARSQARLIEDLLDLSRIVSGKLRLEAKPIELSSVINAAIDTARPAAEAKEIRLQAVLDSGCGLILGDPERLQQVVWNLLANAVKFTPKQGRVQLQLQRVNSHVELTISDTGPGIDEDLLPFIFDRFRQGDSTSTRKHGGLGLGLAIVRNLVELHGGTVEGGNRAEGEGAVFTVRLPILVTSRPSGPLVAEQGGAFVARQGSELSSRGTGDFVSTAMLKGLKVLVVDDEPDAREVLGVLLQDQEAEIMTCASSAEALKALAEFKPDLLLSDIGMEEEDGYTLIEKVRALGPEHGGRTPAVALTAYARVEDRLRALAAGYNMHVTKPIDPDELIMVLASLAGWQATRKRTCE